MRRRFHGSLCTSSILTTLLLSVMDSCSPMLRTRELFYPTNLQFPSYLDSNDTTSEISMQILVSTTEPFVGLRGSDLGSELIGQTNPCTIGPFGNSPRRVN